MKTNVENDRILGIGNPDLMNIRVSHTLEHLRELLPQVDGLEIGAL